DMVSSLLGVKPSVDTGQPIMLALNAAPSAAVVQDMVQALPQPVVAAPAPAEPAAARIVFAAQQEIVQPLPMTAQRTARTPPSS
ncbi:hypothetical protein ACCS63_36215, partial [Rhizobium brockwellii]|uniref:hypothetical protein n=1 Tax=Rhizobium brockwellii TaxID=3019932 RepID=UPI003F98A64D